MIIIFLIVFYVIFSYLVLLGIKFGDMNLPLWNIAIAPIALPILLGKWLAINFDK